MPLDNATAQALTEALNRHSDAIEKYLEAHDPSRGHITEQKNREVLALDSHARALLGHTERIRDHADALGRHSTALQNFGR
jgi:hypothetical protein